MKKLKKILLINWLYFSKELIEVGDVNFLTGKNGAGKSTVIDALQIVLLGETTVLSCYLNPSKQPQTRPRPETVIYPFGLNQSQKIAVENALSSQVSIIQGPPGTGKTQTILNIIANAVRVGKTVAVVSNNNSATLNVAEKLEKKGLSFLTAFLGSLDNKNRFLENQTGRYPDMESWSMEQEEKERLNQEVTALSKELSDMLNAKNRIAEIEQEFLQLKPEQYYFDEHYATYAQAPQDELRGLSSQKILSLWLEYEQHAETESKLGLLQKLSIMFRFNRSALKIFLRAPELVIPYLQRQFYIIRHVLLPLARLRNKLTFFDLIACQIVHGVDSLQKFFCSDFFMRIFQARLACHCTPLSVLNRPEADQLLPPVWRRIFEACHPGIHAVAQLLVDSEGVIILRFPVAHKIRSEFLAAFSIEDTVTIESFLLRFGNEISPAMFTAGNALLILLEIQCQFQQAESV